MLLQQAVVIASVQCFWSQALLCQKVGPVHKNYKFYLFLLNYRHKQCSFAHVDLCAAMFSFYRIVVDCFVICRETTYATSVYRPMYAQSYLGYGIE